MPLFLDGSKYNVLSWHTQFHLLLLEIVFDTVWSVIIRTVNAYEIEDFLCISMSEDLFD
jgi:hypothetical protein